MSRIVLISFTVKSLKNVEQKVKGKLLEQLPEMSGVESSLFKGLRVLESWRPRYITSFNIFTASSSPSIFKYLLNSFLFPC